MTIKNIFKYFAIWQLIILLVVLLAPFTLPLRASDSYLGQGITHYLSNPLVNFRSNFDGVHYVLIATHGYNYGQHAFFPFFPYLIRKVWPIIGSPVLAGTIISSVSFFIALIFLYRLVRMDHKESVAKWTLLSLIFFPTSFYFTTVYTEGLFILLTVLAFYSARKGNWLLAGICGFLAAYTRFIGVFILPSLLWEYWSQSHHLVRKDFRRFVIRAVPLILVPCGLLLYMSYLEKTTGDPMTFYTSQKLFAQSRSLKVVMPYQVIWRYIKMVYTVTTTDFSYLTIWLEFLSGVGFLVLSIFSLLKQRTSYAIYNLFAFLIPTLTGIFVSLPRYILICFPAFILIGQWLDRSKKARIAYFSFSIFFFIIFLTMFARGYWVS